MNAESVAIVVIPNNQICSSLVNNLNFLGFGRFGVVGDIFLSSLPRKRSKMEEDRKHLERLDEQRSGRLSRSDWHTKIRIYPIDGRFGTHRVASG